MTAAAYNLLTGIAFLVLFCLLVMIWASTRRKTSKQDQTGSVVWDSESQLRLCDVLKAFTNEYTNLNVLMASQKHRSLGESLVSIFVLAGWQAQLTQVPLDRHVHHTYFTGIEVLGHNKFLVEAVAEGLRQAGLLGIRATVNEHKIKPSNPKFYPAENKIQITVGYQE